MTPLLTRRAALGALAALPASRLVAAPTKAGLAVAARSPWLANGVAVDRRGTLYLGHPRFIGHEATPSLTRVGVDGRPQPFPGGRWNDWAPGGDGTAALVFVNAVHIFADDSLWVVDQGAPEGGKPPPGAQKLVQFDLATGATRRVLRFDEAILPPGAQLNDLRLHANRVYATDSGLGGIVLHDLASGRSLRRLSGHPLLRKPATAVQRGSGGRAIVDGAGKKPAVNSDVIELTAAGDWLYWSPPTGPIRRVPTAPLWDETVDDAGLGARIEHVAEIPSIGGSAIDTLGNLYLSDAEHRRISLLTPTNQRVTLVADERLVSPDALFIDSRRRLFIPSPQLERTITRNAGRDTTRAPFEIYAMALPASLVGHPLGDAVTGAG